MNKITEFLKSKMSKAEGIISSLRTKNEVGTEYLDYIEKIKQGDLSAKKDFTDRHKGFISETISHSLGKSTIPKNSPEFDIGLEAFYYSINKFNPEKDKDFLLFSEDIIQDWVRSYVREESLKNNSNQIDEEKYYLYCNYESTKDISQFKRHLWEHGIKLSELPNISPEEKLNIGTCVKIARKLSVDNELFEKVVNDRNLSMEDFAGGISLDKRIFNKYRKYIIALTIILKSNLKLLCSYLKNVNLRNEFSENLGVILEANNDFAILFTLQGEFLNIKLNKGNNVGEQIKFGSYRVQKKNKYLKYIIAACAVTSVLICFIVFRGFSMIINSNKPIAAYKAENSPTASISASPADAAAIETPEPETTALLSLQSTPEPTPEPTVTNKPTAKPRPTKAVTPVPSVVTPVPSGITPVPSGAPVSTAANISAKPTQALPSSAVIVPKASGVPVGVRISAKPTKVRVGEKYEVHFYMKSGNNGTTLILYQNNKEYKRFSLQDRTPGPQAKILSFNASTPGTYSYRWELINEFGKASSQTINVIVSN